MLDNHGKCGISVSNSYSVEINKYGIFSAGNVYQIVPETSDLYSPVVTCAFERSAAVDTRNLP